MYSANRQWMGIEDRTGNEYWRKASGRAFDTKTQKAQT